MSRPVQHGQPPYSDDKNDAFEEDKKNMNNMNYEIITTTSLQENTTSLLRKNSALH
jgi:hypothetical protein